MAPTGSRKHGPVPTRHGSRRARRGVEGFRGQRPSRGDVGPAQQHPVVPSSYHALARLAENYALALLRVEHFEESKSVLLKTIPVAQRVLGVSNDTALRMRWAYAGAICNDTAATLDDVREAVTTLEETEQTARRVLGGANPLVGEIETSLREARAAQSAREDVDSISDAAGAL